MSSLRRADEFPIGSDDWPNELSRRRFLKLMGASIALASTSACTRQPAERIVPYQKQPEEIIPGRPLFYATALTLGGYARGVLVETHEGRPTKIEGNPLHPASLGASDVFMQAELLALYDPERSQAVMHNGQIATWNAFLTQLAAVKGSGLRILTRHQTSPTFLDQVALLLKKYPNAKWHEHEPLATGAPHALYHFDKADVILSLGADFLSDLRYARDFASRRRSNETVSRLYVLESTPTLTGAMADQRYAVGPEEMGSCLADLVWGAGAGRAITLAADLRAHAGRCVVVAGEFEMPIVHEAARHLNETLGNVGVTVDYPEPPSTVSRDLRELVTDINTGAVETLVIIGGNPVYDAPVDFEFANLLSKIPRTIHLGRYRDETATLCHWHIPETHELESWSDARSTDGTASIIQPMIEPLFAGRSQHELLSALLEEVPRDSYEIVRAYWQTQHSADFEKLWRKSLHDGIIPSSAHPISRTTVPPLSISAPGMGNCMVDCSLLIRPSPRIYDGRFANNAWLQELPDPLTTIVWDNAALISPERAERMKLVNGDVVNLEFYGHIIRAPIWILPGQADSCVTVHLGYGRSHAGAIGNGVGFNAYQLRRSTALWWASGLRMEKTGEHHEFASTQEHWNMEGRDLVRFGTAKSEEPPPREDETLYPPVAYPGHAWGMVIDLNTCIGCGVCTIACQAENNIPVVGKEQVRRGREMHWIRVDRYFENEEDSLTSPRILHQPVPCMHCENAPCEFVCPVAATVHSSEGLNQMVYNRCIGTRYCSNNCPYKVRRFNFLEYDANQFEQPPTRKLMRNPDVTVRTRGVMEKCTYCIQRINAVKIDASKANRVIRDGEITPACAQACPTDAIVFGDINDANSRVAKFRASPRNYGLLEELNTRPRTTYLAKLRNPNPELS